MIEFREIKQNSCTCITNDLFVSGNGTKGVNTLQVAFQNIQHAAEDGRFTVDIQGDDYRLSLNQTSLQGHVTCPPGMTRVEYFCSRYYYSG